jgi:multisubunit Na+/H+ antiporter MnhB subunit
MNFALAFDCGLAGLILAMAIWTIAARTTFPAVVGFVAYGLLLTLVWMRLAAPDVALTEAAIGGGLTGVLLLGATSRLRATEQAAAAERPGAWFRSIVAGLCVAISAAIAAVVLLLPNPAPTLAPEAGAKLSLTGVGNAVTAVLLAYRALDTLLESAVLLLALVGVWSLAPDHFWGGAPRSLALRYRDGSLSLLGQVLPPIGIVLGVYIVWVGADAPGGKFQGATIIAAMWVLTMMAGLQNPPEIGRAWVRLILVAGAAFFLAVGIAGFWLAGAFLAYPTGFAKSLIVAIEVALTLSVAATLGLLVAGPPARRVRT